MAARSQFKLVQQTGYKETSIVTADSLSELRAKLDDMGGFNE